MGDLGDAKRQNHYGTTTWCAGYYEKCGYGYDCCGGYVCDHWQKRCVTKTTWYDYTTRPYISYEQFKENQEEMEAKEGQKEELIVNDFYTQVAETFLIGNRSLLFIDSMQT